MRDQRKGGAEGTQPDALKVQPAMEDDGVHGPLHLLIELSSVPFPLLPLAAGPAIADRLLLRTLRSQPAREQPPLLRGSHGRRGERGGRGGEGRGGWGRQTRQLLAETGADGGRTGHAERNLKRFWRRFGGFLPSSQVGVGKRQVRGEVKVFGGSKPSELVWL